MSPASVRAIPQLVTDFHTHVQTDLSPQQINQLACLANEMNGTGVYFAGFPMDMFKNAKVFDPQLKTTTSVLDADYDLLRDYIDRFQQGTWPILDPTLVTDAGICD
jgi:hypothetical protein